MRSHAISHLPLPSVPLTAVFTRTRASSAGVMVNAAVVGGDLLAVIALVMCIPFVILAIGIPIALFLQVVLWVGRLL